MGHADDADRRVGWYFEANRRNWDERSHLHVTSNGYGIDRYRADRTLLSDVVRFDRDRYPEYLGDLDGKRAVHLQCHIGTDTLSLARLGADVTGLDQSGDSLRHAAELFASTGTAGRFVESNVYDAADALGERYDLVYTGVGALNWLPDIDRWAKVVSSLLVPGGVLYLREGHPMMNAFDETAELTIRYPYFETEQPMVFDEVETYVDSELPIASTRTYEWNHGLGEVFSALTHHGLTVRVLDEHRSLEWKFFPHMVEDGERWTMPAEQRDLVPLMYTIVAIRNG